MTDFYNKILRFIQSNEPFCYTCIHYVGNGKCESNEEFTCPTTDCEFYMSFKMYKIQESTEYYYYYLCDKCGEVHEDLSKLKKRLPLLCKECQHPLFRIAPKNLPP